MKLSPRFGFVLSFVFACLISTAASAQDTSPNIKGLTLLEYDPETNVVTAYSETFGTYDLMGEYQVEVWLTVTKPNGEVVASGGWIDVGGNPATLRCSLLASQA